MTGKVLVADPLSDAGVAVLRDGGRVDVDLRETIAAEELLETIPAYEALVVRSRTKVTRAVLERGARLKVVGRCGVGLDNIDVEAARARGVAVVAAAGASAVSVAELVIGLIISMTRRLPEADATVRSGRWERSRFQGEELLGKTLGLVGFGNIGREVARRAAAFGMRTLFHDPYLPPGAGRGWARDAGIDAAEEPDVDRLLEASDVVSLHVPLLAETRRLVSAERLGRMKPGAYLVNASRGGIVDEAALAAAVHAGRLAGAALDVFETEPEVSPEIRAEKRIVLTPHIGASTREGQERAGVEVARRVIGILKGEAVS